MRAEDRLRIVEIMGVYSGIKINTHFWVLIHRNFNENLIICLSFVCPFINTFGIDLFKMFVKNLKNQLNHQWGLTISQNSDPYQLRALSGKLLRFFLISTMYRNLLKLYHEPNS